MLLKVYIPSLSLNSKTGILLGTYSVDRNEAYIVAVAEFPLKVGTLSKYISSFIDSNNDKFDVKAIGSWFGQEQNTSFQNVLHENAHAMKRMLSSDQWMCVVQKQSNYEVHLYESGEFVCHPACIFVYNQLHVWKCYTKESQSQKSLEDEELNLFTLVHKQKKDKLLSQTAALRAEENELKITTCCSDRNVSLIFFMLSLFTSWFLNSLGLVAVTANSVLEHTVSIPFKFVHKIICYLLKFSSTGYHTCEKMTQLMECVMDYYNKGISKKVQHILTATFMDITFGVMLLYLLNIYWIPQQKLTNEALLVCVEYIGDQIQELIKWVMGIPAGLKLNDPLNRVLGQFFLYHVRLWLEYIRLVLTTVPNLVPNCIFSACFGISYLLMLISDVISMLSFHVYVFYTYAGRLYNLQITGLISLWRLFLGKKWNPLRNRVDTLDVEYQNTDRLFIGTLMFTVLLFLLPTTLVYYSIFAGLRLAVHLIQRFLWSVTFYVSSFPWVDVLQYVSCPQQFKRTVRYEWINSKQLAKENSFNVLFNLIFVPNSITTVIFNGYARLPRPAFYNSNDIKSFIVNLLHGDLMKWNTL